MTSIFLGTEFDKSGNKIIIKKTDSIAMTPVYIFFLKQMTKLMEDGLAFPVTSWVDHHLGAVYAESDEKIIGHIVYSNEFVHSKKMLWIILSATDEESRGKGIYSILHKHFENIAKEKECTIIASHIHKNNKTRLMSAEKVGMKPIFYYMAKKI
jgi:GNAT superfamily N-acetyltransferase